MTVSFCYGLQLDLMTCDYILRLHNERWSLNTL